MKIQVLKAVPDLTLRTMRARLPIAGILSQRT